MDRNRRFQRRSQRGYRPVNSRAWCPQMMADRSNNTREQQVALPSSSSEPNGAEQKSFEKKGQMRLTLERQATMTTVAASASMMPLGFEAGFIMQPPPPPPPLPPPGPPPVQAQNPPPAPAKNLPSASTQNFTAAPQIQTSPIYNNSPSTAVPLRLNLTTPPPPLLPRFNPSMPPPPIQAPLQNGSVRPDQSIPWARDSEAGPSNASVSGLANVNEPHCDDCVGRVSRIEALRLKLRLLTTEEETKALEYGELLTKCQHLEKILMGLVGVEHHRLMKEYLDGPGPVATSPHSRFTSQIINLLGILCESKAAMSSLMPNTLRGSAGAETLPPELARVLNDSARRMLAPPPESSQNITHAVSSLLQIRSSSQQSSSGNSAGSTPTSTPGPGGVNGTASNGMNSMYHVPAQHPEAAPYPSFQPSVPPPNAAFTHQPPVSYTMHNNYSYSQPSSNSHQPTGGSGPQMSALGPSGLSGSLTNGINGVYHVPAQHTEAAPYPPFQPSVPPPNAAFSHQPPVPYTPHTNFSYNQTSPTQGYQPTSPRDSGQRATATSTTASSQSQTTPSRTNCPFPP